MVPDGIKEGRKVYLTGKGENEAEKMVKDYLEEIGYEIR